MISAFDGLWAKNWNAKNLDIFKMSSNSCTENQLAIRLRPKYFVFKHKPRRDQR